MRLVSKPDCLNWCRQREISISEYDHLYYERVPIHSLVFDLPSRSLEIIGLSNVLSRNLEGDSYSGSLVWLRDWDIWSEDYEESVVRLVSKPDCLNWCRQREISISEYDHLYYERVPIHSLVFDLPSRSLEIIGLSNVLSRNLEGDSYSGSLVWLRDWDIWSEDYEEVGCRLASRLFSDPRRPTRFSRRTRTGVRFDRASRPTSGANRPNVVSVGRLSCPRSREICGVRVA